MYSAEWNKDILRSLKDMFESQRKPAGSAGKPMAGAAQSAEGFDWINLPLVSKRQIAGSRGMVVSEKQLVENSDVVLRYPTPDSSVLMTKGKSKYLPLDVTSVYSTCSDKHALMVTSTFLNTSADTVRCWIGDAIDNDEEGLTSLFPNSDATVQLVVNDDPILQVYRPTLPWMACFGSSNQVFVAFYEGDFSEGFEVSANANRIVSQKQVVIPPGQQRTFTRRLYEITVPTNASKVQAVTNLYAAVYNVDRIETNMVATKTRLEAGSKCTATVTLKNLSTLTTYTQVLVIVKPPISLKSNVDTLVVPKMVPGQSCTVSFNLTAIEGAGNCVLKVETKVRNRFQSSTSLPLFIAGKGWYSGDNHTHSTFSDGHATIEQNVAAAKSKGLSFLNCTDHNTVQQKTTVLNCRTDEFLPFTGSEVTTNAGHALALFCDEVVPWDTVKESTITEAQQVIDDINRSKNGKALSVIAHPYYNGGAWKWTDVVNMKGIEVFNGFNPYRSYQTYKAFQLWDEKLNGGMRVSGFADSDAHIKEMVGRLRICALADELSESAIYDAVRCGRFYGSNGPDLRFSVDSVQMGDSLSVLFKKKVHVSMTAYSCDGLDSVRLIKNGKLFRAFRFFPFTRKAELSVLDEVVPGDYYRMEVNDKLDQVAFSNPVYITYGETTAHYTDNPIVLKDSVEVIHHDGFFVYPNPASDLVTLNLGETTNGVLRVYDEHGILQLRETVLNEREHHFHVGSLPKGLYYLQLNGRHLKLVVR